MKRMSRAPAAALEKPKGMENHPGTKIKKAAKTRKQRLDDIMGEIRKTRGK